MTRAIACYSSGSHGRLELAIGLAHDVAMNSAARISVARYSNNLPEPMTLATKPQRRAVNAPTSRPIVVAAVALAPRNCAGFPVAGHSFFGFHRAVIAPRPQLSDNRIQQTHESDNCGASYVVQPCDTSWFGPASSRFHSTAGERGCG
jgi:hypothetical protein